ncbi:hypothetical protein OQA88_767 [Cercophora sp. LCS_1]
MITEQLLGEPRDRGSELPPSPLISNSLPTSEVAHINSHDKIVLRWRPFYLRRSVLAIFSLVLVLVLGATLALLIYSNQHSGIGTGQSSQHYLWTFGPTAFLTLLAAVWGRIDYQSKLVAPWIRLSQGPAHPNRTLQLDYFADLLPWSVVRAVRNQDFVVFITSAIAVMLKVLIVISTGLIALLWTPVLDSSYPMVVQDTFVDSNARLSNSGTLAYYMMGGRVRQDLTFPDGIHNGYAFQSLKTDPARPIETNVTVDAFEGSLDCKPAGLVLRGSAPPVVYWNDQKMNLTLSSPGCDVGFLQLLGPRYTCDNCPMTFGRYANVSCDESSTSERKRRIFVMFGEMSYVVTKNVTVGMNQKMDYNATLHRSTQLLCTPTITMGRVEVVHNGTETRSVTPISGSFNRTLESVSPWDVTMAHINATSSDINVAKELDFYGLGLNTSGTEVDVDHFMELLLPTQLPPGTPVTSLFDIENLREAATGYYRQSTAIIAKQVLMEPASIEVTGSATRFEDRLVVRPGTAHWMVGILALSLILVLASQFLVPSGPILPCNPSSISGTAMLFVNSPYLVERLQHLGSTDERQLSQALKNSRFQSSTHKGLFSVQDTDADEHGKAQSFPRLSSLQAHPTIVHPVTRAALCATLAGLIIVLELLLRKSTREDGLGDVGDGAYIHYSWTATPAVVLGCLVMVVSAMEFRVRCLTPYVALQQGARALMPRDLLDMSTPRLLYNEVRLGGVGVLAATLALLVGSFFTAFSASLFHTAPFSSTDSITLRANQSFIATPKEHFYNKEQGEVASLILASNLSYPRFTFEDLAFPQLALSDSSMLGFGGFDSAGATIEAIVPAVRPKLTCRLYDRSQVQDNLSIDPDHGPLPYLKLNITKEECAKYTSRRNVGLTIAAGTTYFGIAKESFGNQDVKGCSDLLFVWGKVASEGDPALEHVASLGCNMTMELVDTEVTLTPDLNFRAGTVPHPRAHTARPSAIWQRRKEWYELDNVTNIYYNLATIDSKQQALQIMPFFQLLTTSPWAIPLGDLGDPAADDRIGKAIKFQHGIIVAQSLALNMLPANMTNATFTSPTAGDNDAQRVYQADITQPDARRRVVQDSLSTRILQGLLGTTLVFLALSWFCMPETAVLASSPTTIASRAALIAGGNLLSLFSDDAQLWNLEDVQAAMSPAAARFWMGWAKEDGERRFGIWVLGGKRTVKVEKDVT